MKKVRGIPVRQIDELTEYRTECFVIIAATIEEFYDDIDEKLEQLNFRHRCALIKLFQKNKTERRRRFQKE